MNALIQHVRKVCDGCIMTCAEKASPVCFSSAKREAKLKDQYRVIYIFTIAGLFVYILDAAIDSFVFHDGPFLDVLLFAPLGDVLVRLYISASFIILGMFISRLLANRRKAEEALRESEEFFQSVVDNSSNSILILDEKLKIIYCNSETECLFQYPKKEMVGKDFTTYLTEETKAWVQNNYLQRKNGENMPLTCEFKIVCSDGEKREVEAKTGTIKYQCGRLCYLLQLVDVTDRKKMEERFSALNTCGRQLNTAKSLDEVYRLTLDAIQQTLGFEEAAFMVVDGGKLRLAHQLGFPTPRTFELPLDGTKKGITVRAAIKREPCLVHDVTKDEDYVKSNPLGPNTLSEVAIPVMIEAEVLGVLDMESTELDAFNERDVMLLQVLASHAATAIGNLKKRDEIEKRSNQQASLMKSSAEMIHTSDVHQRLQSIVEAIRELGWRRAVLYLVNEDFETTQIADIVTTGVTEEERAYLWNNRVPGRMWQERIGLKYERFRIGEFFYLPWSDPSVRESFSQDTVHSHLKPEEMVDWDPQDLLYAPLKLADGRVVGIISMDDPEDGKRPSEESLAPLELFLYQAAVAIENARVIKQLNDAKVQLQEYADQLEVKVEDRTRELVDAQKRLLRAERLAAIGELAGMVGHDLRNPLTGIAGATYYLKKKLGLNVDEKTLEMLRLIEDDIQYSNKIINDLLEYSKDIQLQLVETNPKSMLRDALSFVKVPDNVKVLDETFEEPRIRVDIEKMQRVFVNLVKNAFDAMPNGGKLVVKSEKTDDFVRFSFVDTGVGMSKEVMEKIWTPLFTTKSKGMGFGLPICKRIVEAHGGRISAESTADEGSTFIVRLPIEPKVEGNQEIWVNLPESLLSVTKANDG